MDKIATTHAFCVHIDITNFRVSKHSLSCPYLTLVNVYVDLVVFMRIAGAS